MAGRNVFNELTAFLDENKASYVVLDHEPYSSSEEATAITGISPEQAAKALLYRNLGDYVLVALPASERVSSGKLRRALQTRDIRLASPQEVEEVMDCVVGTCHPIGRLAGIHTIADPSLGEHQLISFSTGNPCRTITMEYPEYVRVAQPDIQSIRAIPE